MKSSRPNRPIFLYFCFLDGSVSDLPKNVGDLEKIIVAKGFKKLPKVQ